MCPKSFKLLHAYSEFVHDNLQADLDFSNSNQLGVILILSSHF